MILHLRSGEKISQRDIIKRLTEMQYDRNELEFKRGVFRVRGDVVDVFPAENSEAAVRVSLFDDEVVCVVSDRHPLARKGEVTADDYVVAQHLAPVRYAGGVRGAIDDHLHKLGIKRDIRVSLPYFHVAPYVLMTTDLVFTTGRRFAAHYAKFLPIKVLPAPLGFPSLRFYQLWHERTHAAPAARWLREQVAQVASA